MSMGGRAMMAILAASAAFAMPAYAFTEPAGTPAASSSVGLVNVGPSSQTKTGDLTVGNMKAASAIIFAGEKRSTWLAQGTSCAWEGWKCDCESDGSSVAGISLTFGVKCVGGRVEDARLFGLAISSKTKSCEPSAPAGCAQALYTYGNADSGTFLESAADGISGAASAVGGAVVATAKAAGGVALAVGTLAVDLVVQPINQVIAFGGDVLDAGKDFARTVSDLALDPSAGALKIAVGTGVAAVKAVAAVAVSAVKTGVNIVGAVATGAVKAVVSVAKALCFWC